MTRKPYQPIAEGPIVTCPCCLRDLEITGYDDDGDPAWLDDMSLHATAAPLREQPCVTPAEQIMWRRKPVMRRWFRLYAVCLRWPTHVRGAVCSWIGPRCNVASHVTPVTLEWYARRGRCTLVADVAADKVTAGLARCLHNPST